jgi:hypothetical protein
VFFFVEAGSRPRPRTKRVKFDCTLSADYYNIKVILLYIDIKLLIMENHPSRHQKSNSPNYVVVVLKCIDKMVDDRFYQKACVCVCVCERERERVRKETWGEC